MFAARHSRIVELHPDPLHWGWMQLLLLSFILFPFSISSQIVTVMDEQKAPLPYAHVRLAPIEGNEQLTLFSNIRGKASIPDSISQLDQKVQVKIRHIGFHTLTDTVELSSKSSLSYHLEPGDIKMDQAVVTAQYGEKPQEAAVHKVKVVDEEEIEDQGAVNLRDIMQKETNVRVSRDNVLGSSASVQGISGQNVKILIDGVPVIGRMNGNIDLSQINLNNIERIEIVEGPLSVNYGTDALAGTINLITKKEQKDTLNAEMTSYYGTVGRYNLDGRVGVKLGEGWLSLSGGRNYFDGWSADDPFTLYPKAMPADTNRSKPWDPKEQYFGKLQYMVRKNGWSFRPYAQFFDETIINRGMPHDPYQETAFDDIYQTRRMKGGLDLSRQFDNGGDLKVLAAYNRYDRVKNSYFKDLTTLQKRLTENPSEHETTRFGLWVSRGTYSASAASSELAYSIGYDVSYETAFSERIEGKEQDQGNYALFGSLEWSPDTGLTLRPGVRYGYNTGYDAPLIPSLNMRYELDRVTIRASYARGFRAPSLKELHFRFVDVNHNIHGNPDLKAERSDNLSLDLSWKKITSSSIWKLQGGGSYNDIRERISLARVQGNRFSYVNIGRYKTLGFDGRAEWRRERLRLTLGGAYIGRYNAISDSLPVQAFSFSPEIRSSIRYRIPKIAARAAAFYEYTGALPGFTTTDDGQEVRRTRIGSYQILDLTLSKHFWEERVEWTLGIKNLFDMRNVDATATSGGAHSGGARSVTVGRGRSYFTELSFNFSR